MDSRDPHASSPVTLAGLAALMALPALLWQAFPVTAPAPSPGRYPLILMAMAAMVAVMATMIHVNGRSGRAARGRIFAPPLSLGFLAVALLGLLAGASIGGLFPSLPPRAGEILALWQRSLLAAMLLLHVAATPPSARRGAAIGVASALGLAVLGLAAGGMLPLDGIAQGLPLGLYLAAMAFLFAHRGGRADSGRDALLAILVPLALGELFQIQAARGNGPATLAAQAYLLVALYLMNRVMRAEGDEQAHCGTSPQNSSTCHQYMIDHAPEGIFIMDDSGRIEYANHRMASMLGCPAEQMAGRMLESLIPDSHMQVELSRSIARLPKMLSAECEYRLSTVFQGLDGTRFPADINLNRLNTCERPRITAFVRDMTERSLQENLLRSIATHDELTGLPNRMQLQELLAARMLSGGGGALLLLDLDHFRHVNDSLGHEYGDLLLVALCARLVEHLPAGTALARFSGDELVALIGDADRARAAKLAEDIIAILEEPFVINDWEYIQSVSLGIALFPSDGEDVSQLVRKADLALGWAKAAGRRTYQFFDGPVAEKAQRRRDLQGMLRHALERREFHLHYQPRMNLARGCVTDWEALLRWNNPREGAIGPAEFIPVAEESGLILEIGDWVLRQALEQHARWQAMGLAPGNMAVNLSARQLRTPDLPQRVAAALAQTGVRPDQLELEITETALMEDVSTATRILDELNRMGVKLSVDDFGTGYSSLGYLRAFPLNKLKIDRSFVLNLGDDGQMDAIVKTIIVLGQTLNLTVVAEGVETESQLRYLIDHKCDEIQGYLFSKPLPPEACEHLLREQKRQEACLRTGSGVAPKRAAA